MKSGEAEKDKIWTLQRLDKDWRSYFLAIYSDGSATNGTAMGEGGILFTAGHPSNPTIHHSYAIPAGTWSSSYQAETKAIKKALQIIQTEESPQKFPIVCDNQSVLLRIACLQPAIPTKNADVSDILVHLASIHDGEHQITFTWFPSHCGVVENEMAYEQARRGAATNQEDVRTNYDSAKPIIRRATRGGKISRERIRRMYGMKGEKLDRRVESKLLGKVQTMMCRLTSGNHPEVKYWLYKVGRAVDTICRKCGIREETAEHVVYDWHRIHHPPHEPTPPDTLAKDPQTF